MKILLTMFIAALIMASACIGASQTYYTIRGANIESSNYGDWFADYDEVNYLDYNLTVTADSTLTYHAPALVGNVDGDTIPDIIYSDDNGVNVLNWDQDTQNFVLKYTFSNIRSHTPITLYDGDSDGKDELYLCGIDTTIGNSSFFSLEVNASGSAGVKWQHQVGDGVTNPDTGRDMGCGFVQYGLGGGVPSQFKTVYTPVCDVLQNGSKYCYFVGGCDVSSCTGRDFGLMTFYRFDAVNGGETKFEPASTPNTLLRQVGSNTYAMPFGTTAGSHLINGNSKVVNTPIANVDGADTEKEWLIFMNGDTPGGPLFKRFAYLINIETMGKNTGFGTNGVVLLYSSVATEFSSPSCLSVDGYSYDFCLFVFELTASYTRIYYLTGSGTKTEIAETTNTITRTSNIIFGELNGDYSRDVGAMVKTTGGHNVFFGANFLGLFTKDVEYDAGVESRDLTPSIVSTDPHEQGTGPSNLAGDLNLDFITSYGIFMVYPDNQSVTRAKHSPYMDQSSISLADVNSDGFTDILTKKQTTLRVILANTTEINEIPDLLYVIPAVRGRTMCYGNQYYSLPSGGYTDAESNNVRVSVRCNATADYNATAFSAYGTSFILSCPYNATGAYIATICLQDNIHPTDMTECLNIETVVSNAEGCVEGTPTFDIVNIVTDTDPDDSVTPPGALKDIKTQLSSAYGYLGGRDQSGRDIISIFIIIISIISIAVSIPVYGWIVGIIAGVLLMSVFSFTASSDGGTMLSPVYLMVLIIMSLVLLFIIRPLLSKGGD